MTLTHMLQHKCIDCGDYIVPPNAEVKLCMCDFKPLTTKTPVKPMKIAKEVEDFIKKLAERDEITKIK